MGAETKPVLATTASEQTAAEQQPATLLDQIVLEGRLGQTDEERKAGREWLTTLVQEVMDEQITVSSNTGKMLKARIAELDEQISLQLNEVLHAPAFQKMEGAWRGLHYLVQQSETSTMLKLKLMNISKDDLLTNLTDATEFDQSDIFKKVYEEEFGTLGGHPFGALVGDYEFTRHPQDIALLENMSNVAAAAHAPFVTGANPSLFNLQSYSELGTPRDLAKVFDSDAYISWNQFRQSEDSRYVGLCLPHVLMRLPYGKETEPIKSSITRKTSTDGTIRNTCGGMPRMRSQHV